MKWTDETNKPLQMALLLITLAVFVFVCAAIAYQVKASNHADKMALCLPATQSQMELINYGIKDVQSSNYAVNGWIVRSDEFQRVYIVAAWIYGPGIESGAGPGVWAVGGEPDQPGTILAVNGFAKQFTAFPNAGLTDAEITLSTHGVDESIYCAEHAKAP